MQCIKHGVLEALLLTRYVPQDQDEEEESTAAPSSTSNTGTHRVRKVVKQDKEARSDPVLQEAGFSGKGGIQVCRCTMLRQHFCRVWVLDTPLSSLCPGADMVCGKAEAR